MVTFWPDALPCEPARFTASEVAGAGLLAAVCPLQAEAASRQNAAAPSGTSFVDFR
jgi:hypothetical protein